MDITFCQWFPSAPWTMISYMPFLLQWKMKFFVAGDDPNKQTRNETSRGVSYSGYIRDYFTGRQNKKTTENQRWRLTVI